jgi:hypothetical protein
MDLLNDAQEAGAITLQALSIDTMKHAQNYAYKRDVRGRIRL